MLHGRFLGLVGTTLLAAPLAAQTADPLAGKVQNLAHPRYAEREKAARELEAAGEPALAALKPALQSKDEELRARAAVVAERIERAVRSDRLLAPPKLALKFDKTPLDQAVREFSAKTQIRAMLDKTKIKNPDRTVTVDTGEVPFWEAVHAFYKAAELAEDDSPLTPSPVNRADTRAGRIRQLELNGGPGRAAMGVTRLADGPPVLPADLAHALRVRALPVNHTGNQYDETRGEVTFQLDVDSAPGVPLREVIGIEVRKVTADDGRELAAAHPVPPIAAFGWEEQMLVRQIAIASGDLEITDSTGGSARAVTLKTGGLRPKKLAELRGVVVARVVAPPEPLVTLGQLLSKEGREASGEGMTVQVQGLKSDKDGRTTVQLRLVTRTDLADDVLNLPIQLKGQVRQFIRINRGGLRADPGKLPDFKVLDRAGQPLKGLSAQVTGMTFDGTTMAQDVRMSFDKPAAGLDDLSLVLLGKRTVAVEMPFVLKDVPLP
jgi:hypothetical protein